MTANILRRRVLSRRTFLRGAGSCVMALPWLDAMGRGLATNKPGPRRCMFVFAPNGKKMDDWYPSETGVSYRPSFLLEPLAPFRERLLVTGGLTLDGGRAHGDGPGDHARAAASFLTAAHPRKTDGADIHNGVSIDQVIATASAERSQPTRFASLELGLEPGRAAGRCDSGYSCAYTDHIAWSSPTRPVAVETDPRALFVRLFGDPDALLGGAAQRAAAVRRRSVLDAVRVQAGELRRTLGPSDRSALDEYLDSVRELEQRVARLEADTELPQIEVPASLDSKAPRGPSGFTARLDVMYELCALAFATDSTRVITLMLGKAGSGRSYRFLGAPEGHHDLSHHRNDPDKLDKIRKINRFHVERFAAFLQRLAEAREPGGAKSDLLDSTVVLYGSGLADGNAHRHEDLPILVVGDGRRVGFGRGRHERWAKDTPLANLHLSIARSMGVDLESFADSTGALF